MPERIFGGDPDWKADVPDFSDMPAGGVTDDAGEHFQMPVVQDFSEAPASAAVEDGVHLISPENQSDKEPQQTDESKVV